METKRQETKAVRTCKNCGADMRAGCGDLTFQQHDLVITVHDVPMSICDACGERYVPGPVGVALSEDIEGIVHTIEARSQDRIAVQVVQVRATRELQSLCPA